MKQIQVLVYSCKGSTKPVFERIINCADFSYSLVVDSLFQLFGKEAIIKIIIVK